MSKSITELLKTIALNTDDTMRKDNEIYNTEGLQNEQVAELDESIEMPDQYNNVMKNEGLYNGAYLPLKENGLQKLMGQRKFDFTLTSAIDPNFKRSQIDPDNAMPSYNKYSKFSLKPESVEPPTSQISLVRQSKASYLNYRNRLEPQAEQQQQQTAPSLAPRNGKIEEGYDHYADMDDDYSDSPPAYDFDDETSNKETVLHKNEKGEVVHTTDHVDETNKETETETKPVEETKSGIPIFGEDPVGYVPPKSRIPIFGEDPVGYKPTFRKKYSKQTVASSRSSNLLFNKTSKTATY